MMELSDRHCRYFFRRLSARARLYTEMITSDAVLHGDRARLLGFDPSEHPVALQLGGADPTALAEAARIGAAWGYDEINLNVGCPSDRVQAGCFGARLMREADLVADCVAAMRGAVRVPVTVKCRIGVDEDDPRARLPAFVETVAAARAQVFIVHARKAWLQGLSPKENRTVPPIEEDVVREMKAARPDLQIIFNGEVRDLARAEALLGVFDGVMVGRGAYDDPYLLAGVDRRLFGEARPAPARRAAAEAMIPYLEAQVAAGGRPHAVTRHMLGLFKGEPGARGWRRSLSEEAVKPGAGAEVLTRALHALPPAVRDAA